MHRHVLVPLLEPVVLLDVVEVIAPDDHGPVHLHLGDDPGEDSATDGDLADEGALLVDVVALLCLKYFKSYSACHCTGGTCATLLFYS